MYKTIRSYFQKCTRFAFFTTTVYGLRFRRASVHGLKIGHPSSLNTVPLIVHHYEFFDVFERKAFSNYNG